MPIFIWKDETNNRVELNAATAPGREPATFLLQTLCWITVFLSRWGLVNVNIGLALRPGSSWLRAQALQLCVRVCADMRVRVCMPEAFVTLRRSCLRTPGRRRWGFYWVREVDDPFGDGVFVLTGWQLLRGRSLLLFHCACAVWQLQLMVTGLFNAPHEHTGQLLVPQTCAKTHLRVKCCQW